MNMVVANLSWTSDIEVGQTTDQPTTMCPLINHRPFLPSHPSIHPPHLHTSIPPSILTYRLNQSVNRTIDQSLIGTAAAPSEADTTSATTIHLFGCRIESTFFVSSTVDRLYATTTTTTMMTMRVYERTFPKRPSIPALGSTTDTYKKHVHACGRARTYIYVYV
eukprot:GHVU01205125.1.p1 GENE.GHVU01205125.1~~GHVU01205125.1.p1  ORF type:complete len:164 (+),score=15.63 GHVU01205125.1:184-675(+)